MSDNKNSILATWSVSDARAQFSKLLDAAIKKGPQLITRNGIPTAVVVSVEAWNRLQRSARPGLETRSLRAEPRLENLAPPRRDRRRRTALKPEDPDS